MKKFLLIFKNRIVLFIGSILTLSLIPYLILSQIAPNVNRYEVDFTYSNEVNISELITYDNLNKVKQAIIDYRNEVISSGEDAPYSDFSYVDISSLLDNNIKINETNDYYTISVKQNSFNSIAQAKRFLKGVISNEDVIEDSTVNYINSNIIEKIDTIVATDAIPLSILISFVIVSILFILLYFFKRDFFNEEIKYDNEKLYRTPFHKSYWKGQFRWLHNVRDMVLIAILFALMKVVGLISLPSGFTNLGIGFSYLIFSIIGLLYGPGTGFLIGVISDVIGYLMDGTYVFHIGYTLNAALAGFIYGLALYKTNITFNKCFVARIFVNLFVNVFLGAIWWGQVSGFNWDQTMTYMIFTSLPKNLIYLLPQSILLFVFVKALTKPLLSLNAISEEQALTIKLI